MIDRKDLKPGMLLRRIICDNRDKSPDGLHIAVGDIVEFVGFWDHDGIRVKKDGRLSKFCSLKYHEVYSLDIIWEDVV